MCLLRGTVPHRSTRGAPLEFRKDQSTGRSMLWPTKGNATMTLGTILLIVLILMLVGALPAWPHSKRWGYAPGGTISLVLIVVLILLLTGRL